MRPIGISLLLLLYLTTQIHGQDYTRALIHSDQQSLATLGIAVDHVHVLQHGILGDFSSYELDLAYQVGMKIDTLFADAEVAYANQEIRHHDDHSRNLDECVNTLGNLSYQTPKNFKLGSYAGHFTYSDMQEQLDQMKAMYPGLISRRRDIGDYKTFEGRPIEWVRISDNVEMEESHEPQILYTALHHAREPISLTQMIYYMWYLLENYQDDPTIRYLVDNTEMYFIPCVNPDGYVYNEKMHPKGGGLWRKNRRVNADGSHGVDLNRNYGYQWGYDNAGSSSNPKSEVFRGATPFSEPETRAVRDFVTDHNFKIALNYHSFGGYLIYPYGYTREPSEDIHVYRQLAGLLTQENRYQYGTGLETLAYHTNGDADDWMYSGEGADKVFSMTPEIGEDGFWPEQASIEQLCQASLSQNLTAAAFLLNSAILIDNSESYVTEKTGNLAMDVVRLGFEDVAINLKLRVLTNNLEFSTPSKLYILDVFGVQQEQFDYVLSSNIQDGERIKIEYSFDNGTYVERDTLIKYYREPRFALNNAGALEEWTSGMLQHEWGESTSWFVSAPHSLTDSPNGNTTPYTSNILKTRDPILLIDGDSVSLTFMARWDIQHEKDFMTVEVSTDGVNFEPLCGKYSVPGKVMLSLGNPVYTGRQLTWVVEKIDLTEYLGQEIYLMFKMVSTDSDTRDGVYIDNIRILEYNEGSITSANNVEPARFEGTLVPNPASQRVSLNALSGGGYEWLVIVDQLGRRVLSHNLSDGNEVDLSDVDKGLYFYGLIDEKGVHTQFKKLVIVG